MRLWHKLPIEAVDVLFVEVLLRVPSNGQVGEDPEKPNLVGGSPACIRRLELDDL